MSGALAGAYHGYTSIPDRWLRDLVDGEKGLSYVLQISDALAEMSVDVK